MMEYHLNVVEISTDLAQSEMDMWLQVGVERVGWWSCGVCVGL